MSLEGKVALVTGASRGIGAAIAKSLAEQGAMVIGTATSDSGADAISQRFADQNLNGKGFRLQVNEEGTIDALIKEITAEFGAPTILINNAGITRDNLLLRMKDDEWQDVIDTNLNAVFKVTKACLRGMTKARWGRVVNISSVVGSMGNPGQANYAATKAAVAGFARSLGKEIAARGITVNTVAPGFIETDMTAALDDSQRDLMLSAVPMSRLGAPEEIASVVGFLCSDGAAYVTGETVHVNGGMYMT